MGGKSAIYKVIAERRAVYSFRPDPVPDMVLARILAAAHCAPSVGLMQPWTFLLVGDDRRANVCRHVEAERKRGAGRFKGLRRQLYNSLKLEGIKDAPINLAVLNDPSRGGRHVLGRNTIRETDVYSVCLAIENLWLAAHAEGLGVGWVSLFVPTTLHSILDLPSHIELVAYLCIGWPSQRVDAPQLERAGWAKRRRLEDVVKIGNCDAGPSGGFLRRIRAASRLMKPHG